MSQAPPVGVLSSFCFILVLLISSSCLDRAFNKPSIGDLPLVLFLVGNSLASSSMGSQKHN